MIKIADLFTLGHIGFNLVQKKIPRFPITATFEVTSKCTLKCKHCYWWQEKHGSDLDNEVFYRQVIEIKRIYPSLISAVWMGGEPLLRPELIKKCLPIFSFNEVITNGTLPLPAWKNVRFACSVDGTEKFDEAQRGGGTYQKVKKNINRSDLNVHLNCVVTKINQQCLEDFVEEWRQTHIRSIGFAFYTPIGAKTDKEIWLNFKERDQVIDRLINLKNKYPNFISNSYLVLNNFRSNNCRPITRRCRRDYAPFNSLCFNSEMKRKFPCIIGSQADCERCGCPASMFAESIKQGDFSFIKQHLYAVIGKNS